MPSFDIVSQVNSMEIENAVNIAKKELANRFDFRGTKAEKSGQHGYECKTIEQGTAISRTASEAGRVFDTEPLGCRLG